MNTNNLYKHNLNAILNATKGNNIVIVNNKITVEQINTYSYKFLNSWFSNKKPHFSLDLSSLKNVINGSFYHYLNVIQIIYRNLDIEILNTDTETIMNTLNKKEYINNLFYLLNNSINNLDNIIIKEKTNLLNTNSKLDIESFQNFIQELKNELKTLQDFIKENDILVSSVKHNKVMANNKSLNNCSENTDYLESEEYQDKEDKEKYQNKNDAIHNLIIAKIKDFLFYIYYKFLNLLIM